MVSAVVTVCEVSLYVNVAALTIWEDKRSIAEVSNGLNMEVDLNEVVVMNIQ